MSSPVRTVDGGMRVATAARILNQEDIGSVVVTDDDRLLGIVTESDIVRSVGAGHDPERMTVARLMTEAVTTVEPSATLQEVCDLMADQDVKRLPVVNPGPVGIVTTTDVAHELAQDIDDVLAAFQ